MIGLGGADANPAPSPTGMPNLLQLVLTRGHTAVCVTKQGYLGAVAANWGRWAVSGCPPRAKSCIPNPLSPVLNPLFLPAPDSLVPKCPAYPTPAAPGSPRPHLSYSCRSRTRCRQDPWESWLVGAVSWQGRGEHRCWEHRCLGRLRWLLCQQHTLGRRHSVRRHPGAMLPSTVTEGLEGHVPGPSQPPSCGASLGPWLVSRGSLKLGAISFPESTPPVRLLRGFRAGEYTGRSTSLFDCVTV